jgi:hypothetical protein
MGRVVVGVGPRGATTMLAYIRSKKDCDEILAGSQSLVDFNYYLMLTSS